MVVCWSRHWWSGPDVAVIPVSEDLLFGFACEIEHGNKSIAERRRHLRRVGRGEVPEVGGERSRGSLWLEDGARG